MGSENLQQHINAISDLWRIQKSRGMVTGDNPRSGAAIKGMIRRHQRRKESRRRALFIDNGAGTLADGYRQNDVARISSYFFAQGTLTSFRSRLDFLLGHSMLCRSEDKRNAFLSNLEVYELEDEGPTPCYAIVLNFTKSKTNQDGRKEIGAAIRHKDAHQCSVGGLGFYLFYRFHMSGEPFPDLSSNQSWYRICLLRGKDSQVPLRYNQQWQSISSCFDALQIQSNKKTHAMRGQGKKGLSKYQCLGSFLRMLTPCRFSSRCTNGE